MVFPEKPVNCEMFPNVIFTTELKDPAKHKASLSRAILCGFRFYVVTLYGFPLTDWSILHLVGAQQKGKKMVFGLRKPVTPNPIDTIDVPRSVGCMGLVACPGTRIDQPPRSSRRIMEADLNEIADWGANGVLCLLEPHELKLNKVEGLPVAVQSAGMWWKHLPIIDMDIPNQQFENIWAVEGERIRHALRIGERVAIHCYAGLGRTGMMAARILVEFGVDPEQAIRRVRMDNRRRIQTKTQSNFVRSCYSLVGTESD